MPRGNAGARPFDERFAVTRAQGCPPTSLLDSTVAEKNPQSVAAQKALALKNSRSKPKLTASAVGCEIASIRSRRHSPMISVMPEILAGACLQRADRRR